MVKANLVGNMLKEIVEHVPKVLLVWEIPLPLPPFIVEGAIQRGTMTKRVRR